MNSFNKIVVNFLIPQLIINTFFKKTGIFESLAPFSPFLFQFQFLFLARPSHVSSPPRTKEKKKTQKRKQEGETGETGEREKKKKKRKQES